MFAVNKLISRDLVFTLNLSLDLMSDNVCSDTDCPVLSPDVRQVIKAKKDTPFSVFGSQLDIHPPHIIYLLTVKGMLEPIPSAEDGEKQGTP